MKHFLFEYSNLKKHIVSKIFGKRAQRFKNRKINYLGISYVDDKSSIYHTSGSHCNHTVYNLIGDINLHNREEISRIISDHTGFSNKFSDKELVLRCYCKMGTTCLDHIIGDFSFIIWNKLTGELFAARDHLGVKQLYYKERQTGIFSFSSSLREIMTEKGVRSAQINPDYVLDYLLGLSPESDRTIFSSIFQLSPAHYLKITSNKIEIKKYWVPKISYVPKIFSKSARKKEFIRIFTRSIAERLNKGKKIGLLLSGGLDSTSILCILYKKLKVKKESIFLVSKISSDPDKNYGDCDANYIKVATSYTDTTTNYCTGPFTTVTIDTLNNYYEKQCNIPWSLFIVPTTPYEKMLNTLGVETVFCGMGGDELVSIDQDNKEIFLFLSGRVCVLYRVLKKEQKKTGKSLIKIFIHKVLFPLIPKKVQTRYRKIRQNLPFDVIANSFINEAYINRLKLNKYASKKCGWWNRKQFIDPRKEIQMSATSGYFAPFLEHLRLVSESISCEYANPFMDKRMIEFCLSVPASEYVKDGVSRSLLRNYMRGIIPDEIAGRESKTLITDTDDILMMANKELFDEVVSLENSVAWKYIDRNFLIQTFEDLIDDKIKKKYKSIIGYQISKAVNIAAFLQWFESCNEVSIE